jgi:hypothetical protein
MAGFIEQILQTIQYLYDLNEKVKENKNRCKMLKDRCLLFDEKLNFILSSSHKDFYNSKQKSFLSLQNTIQECCKFIEKYGKKGWTRFCVNTVMAQV